MADDIGTDDAGKGDSIRTWLRNTVGAFGVSRSHSRIGEGTMRRWIPVCSLGVLMFLAFGSRAATAAGLLTFETTPDGSIPTDNALLTTPYAIPGGSVRFYFDFNGNNTFDEGTDLYPAFERRGVDPIRGFASNFNFSDDRARPGYEDQLGLFFLRHPSVPFGTFIAHYDTTTPITELSGEIWDIDGVASSQTTERWRVDVINGTNDVVASVLSPEHGDFSLNSLDGLPWTFQFRDLPPGVEKVRLTFVGTKTSGLGLGFNNFSPTVALPEPSSIGLIASGIGLLAGGMALRRRRSRTDLQGA